MDEPIICPRNRRSCHSMASASLSENLDMAMLYDEKDEFMRLIKDPGFKQVRHLFRADRIFEYDAFEIAIAVFNGETQGIIDIEEGLHGIPPLHLAAYRSSPRLTKYLLETGHNADVVCDPKIQNIDQNLKPATPLDIALKIIRCDGVLLPLFHRLSLICIHNRKRMEVIRMLVQHTQNTKRIRQAFVTSVILSNLDRLAMIFLAVPELFLSTQGGGFSSLSELIPEVNSWENKTEFENQLCLLLDVLPIIGHKLAAYIRLEESDVCKKARYASFSSDKDYQLLLEMGFFFREVARKKLGVSYLDYYLSFFDNGRRNSKVTDMEDWDECISVMTSMNNHYIFSDLIRLVRRKDFDRTDIYSLIPSLDPESADLLNSAVEKKLSSMSTLHGCLQTNANISMERDEKGLSHHGVPLVSHKSFKPCVRSFHTGLASAKPIFDVNYCNLATSRENKVVQSNKLTPFFSIVKLPHFPLVAKRLLK